jgi:hypothetical protein
MCRVLVWRLLLAMVPFWGLVLPFLWCCIDRRFVGLDRSQIKKSRNFFGGAAPRPHFSATSYNFSTTSLHFELQLSTN